MSDHPRELLPVTVYLPPEVIADLDAEAKLEFSTLSAVARRVLVNHAKARLTAG